MHGKASFRQKNGYWHVARQKKYRILLAGKRFTDSNVKRIIICHSCIDLVKLGSNRLVELAYSALFLPSRIVISIGWLLCGSGALRRSV
jgi:hypothetical protein